MNLRHSKFRYHIIVFYIVFSQPTISAATTKSKPTTTTKSATTTEPTTKSAAARSESTATKPAATEPPATKSAARTTSYSRYIDLDIMLYMRLNCVDRPKLNNISNLYSFFDTACRTKNTGPEPDKPCVFPFQYMGKEYNECTTDGYGSTYWCGTTFTVTNVGWGVCSSSCISAPGN